MVGLNHWYQAWQSAAPYGEWLGPTIKSVIEQALIDGAKTDCMYSLLGLLAIM